MNLDEYVGLPYRDNGRDREGCDCWGLVRLVFAEKANIALPSYSELYRTAEDDAANEALIAGHLDVWTEIAESDVRPLDCLLMKMAGKECHIGVVVKPGYVLHTGLLMRVSRIELYNSIRIKKRKSRFMRHKALI
jgi:cell wall-associated NlpC family hydrolase